MKTYMKVIEDGTVQAGPTSSLKTVVSHLAPICRLTSTMEAHRGFQGGPVVRWMVNLVGLGSRSVVLLGDTCGS